MPDGKVSAQEDRAKKLQSLRLQVNQSSAWQLKILELIEEINHDNLKLRKRIAQIESQVVRNDMVSC